MPWRADSRRIALAFAALGHETRLRIIARLAIEGPLPMAQLSGSADMTRQAIAKHLIILAGAGLVHAERRGRQKIWQVDDRRLAEAREWLDRVSAQWDASLERLRAPVEQPERK